MSPSGSPPRKPTGAPPATTRPRVLFVDDEPMVLQSLAVTLRKRFEVITASDARTALELLEHEEYPVVVSDCRMPGMDGLAFLGRVRETHPATVRILLTGAGAEGEEGTESPGLLFRVLSKPCPRAALIGAIDEALEQARDIAPYAARGPDPQT